MMYPKVSVILPCYGVEKYLDRCMTSLLSQTLQNIEIIMVDDVSPDRVPLMCDEYARRDSRVKVIHKTKNEGLGFARNTGLTIASGEYVAFFDSDDFVDVHMLEDLYDYAKQNNLDACFCGYNVYVNDLNIRVRQEKKDFEICEGREAVDSVLLDMVGAEPSYYSDVRILSSMWKGIYSLNVIKHHDLQFVSERQYIAEDIVFHIDFLPCAQKVGFIPQCYYYYCENGTSLTRSYRADRFERELIQYAEMKSRMKKKGLQESFFIERLDRYLLLKIRSCLSQQYKFIGTYGRKKMKQAAQKILCANEVSLMLARYPYHQLCIKHKVFFILCKYKCVFLLFCLFGVAERLRKF